MFVVTIDNFMNTITPVDILAFGVHPDDVELSASGTLLRHKALGYSFGLCDLTQGELGTRGDAETRKKEALDSAKYMQAAFRVNLGLADGFIQHDEATIRVISAVIRAAKPKIVLANALDDRHPDHGRSAKIVQDACFYSGLEKIKISDQDGNPLLKHRPQAVYHYVQDKNIEPDFVVDITDYIEQKFEAILKFSTQFYTIGMEGPATPISGKDFMDFLRAKNKSYGRSIQVDYAEAFNVARLPGVSDLFDLV